MYPLTKTGYHNLSVFHKVLTFIPIRVQLPSHAIYIFVCLKYNYGVQWDGPCERDGTGDRQRKFPAAYEMAFAGIGRMSIFKF